MEKLLIKAQKAKEALSRYATLIRIVLALLVMAGGIATGWSMFSHLPLAEALAATTAFTLVWCFCAHLARGIFSVQR